MNITTVYFAAGSRYATAKTNLWQWDYGQILRIQGLDLPDAYQVEFSNQPVRGTAAPMIGGVDGVEIPDVYLTTGKAIYAFVVLHTGETDRETEYRITINVNARPQPADVQPTPEQQGVIDQLIAALNVGVEESEEAAAAAAQSAQGSAQSAADAAESAQAASGSATSAESYAGQAETAAGLAQAAQTASEAARDAAQTAQASAESSATAASGSATSAAGSATAAAGSASDAGASASAASQAATQAEAAQTAAEDAQQAAEQAAQDAHVEYEQLAGQVTAQGQAITQNTEDIADLDTELTQQKSAIDDLTALVDRKAGMLVDTASGAVASFVPDGTIDNLLGVSVDVEPAQDLHGYDSPWPAGGGKNMFDKDHTVNSTYTSSIATALSTYISTGQYATGYTTNATSLNNNAQYCTTFTPCTNGTTYTIKNLTSGSNLALIGFVDDSGTVVSHNSAWSNQAWTHAADSTEKYIMIGAKVAELENVMIVEGSTMPASPSPYANICPISGWDSVDVESMGVNLWDKATVQIGYVDNANGAIVPNNDYRNTGFIKVTPGAQYYVATEQTSGLWAAWYDKSQAFVSGFTSYRNSVITAPPSAKYVALTVLSTTSGNIDTFAFNYPSTDHDYHPYAGNRYTITLGQTVYGGTLDVTNGTMTVDRAMLTLDGSEAWQKDSTAGGFNRYYLRNDAVKKYISYIDHMWSNAMETAGSYAYFDNVIGDFAVTAYPILSVGGNYIYIVSRVGSSGEITTVDSLKQWLANQPVQVMYELATPVEIQLDPVTISTISGQTNNVWADAGDVSVEFAADLKTYIDSKIAAAVAALS